LQAFPFGCLLQQFAILARHAYSQHEGLGLKVLFLWSTHAESVATKIPYSQAISIACGVFVATITEVLGEVLSKRKPLESR